MIAYNRRDSTIQHRSPVVIMIPRVQNLLLKLDDENIKYDIINHEPVTTVDEVLNILPNTTTGILLKNMFLYDEKNNYYIFTCKHDTNVDIKLLIKILNIKKLRFANEERLKECLDIPKGSISPLAGYLHKCTHLTILLEDQLMDIENIWIHPNTNISSIQIKTVDMINFINNHIDAKLVYIKCQKETQDNIKKEEEENILGITAKKSENFAEWYTQVITKSEMIDYYDVSGCYIIRPWAFFIWEQIQLYIDTEIKKLGVENAYLPMFVTKEKLETEKSHVAGFSPEVAWVTRYGDSELSEPIAIRPTSETIIGPCFSKWIRSHRDLPLLLNMWNTVVRWEFKQPTPFLRTREFLWQEGHTCHATEEEAKQFMLQILDIYCLVYEEILAVPMIKGYKSEGEKFCGGDITSTIETLIPGSGRSIQAATSHYLGQNFSKMFNVEFEGKDKQKCLAYQTSWGFTTRSIGIAVMIHGDDKGLVLPPKVARIQVVLVPIVYGDNKSVIEKCEELQKILKLQNIRCYVDDRDNYTPGWKYNYWEVKGVPIRIEIGPKDIQNNSCRVVRRDNSNKIDVKMEVIGETIQNILTAIQSDLLTKARDNLIANIVKTESWEEIMTSINNKKLVLVPWCGDIATEDIIKEKTQKQDIDIHNINAATGPMKPLCFPFQQEPIHNAKCFVTGKQAKGFCLFGRSY